MLASLWRKKAAREAGFRTVGGARVRVIYPGRESASAGPDFRDALLELEGVGLVRGDVELHVNQRDWDHHGHGGDPRYNSVVLHAALWVDSPTTKLPSGIEAPVISLEDLADTPEPPPGQSGQIMWKILARQGYPKPATQEELAALLDRAGDERFLAKSRAFGTLLHEQPAEQALYEGLMEGLGYTHNQHPFVMLAQRAPYESVRRAALNLRPDERTQAIEGWLVRLSGMAAALPETRLPSGLGPVLSGREWHCFRLRPANHPLRRITGMAHLLVRNLKLGLLEGLLQAADAATPPKLTRALTVESQGERGGAYIGQSRARDLAVNVVLPLLQSLDGNLGALSLYRRFGKLQDNVLVQEMADQLIDPAWRSTSDNCRRQQGLLHLRTLLGMPR